MEGALAGIRVLDFSTLLPGPMATLFLAEAGAEVIKVERPDHGEEMRSYLPKWGTDSANFNMLNRGKKSVTLDLKAPKERARLLPLLATTDILVEQFRPGVMARFGLSYDDVKAIKPDIVYCSITGYGQDGPAHLRAGHDLNYQGDTGLLALSLGTAETPVIPPALIADIAGGTYPALVNILLALRRRDRTGESAYLDISMAEGLFPFLYWALADGQATGQWPGNGTSLVTGGSSRYQLYPTSDGRFAAVAALEQKFWESFCEAIGLASHLRDDRVDPAATTAGVAKLILAETSQHWAAVFALADCCCSIVRTLSEALQDPHFRVRGVFAARLANDHGEELMALPTPICRQFKAHPDTIRRAPVLGADTRELD
jgi:alpha-methylacyl-CoA racemase